MFIAINKLSVDKMRNSLLLAELDGLCNQGVHWPFVIMLIHRDYVKERGYAANIDHFQEADKFFIPIGTNKLTSIQICREFSPQRFNIFPEVPEPFLLPNGGFVVNPLDPPYEFIVKWYNPHYHSALGSAPNILS